MKSIPDSWLVALFMLIVFVWVVRTPACLAHSWNADLENRRIEAKRQLDICKTLLGDDQSNHFEAVKYCESELERYR
jgi:hypothetical protein